MSVRWCCNVVLKTWHDLSLIGSPLYQNFIRKFTYFNKIRCRWSSFENIHYQLCLPVKLIATHPSSPVWGQASANDMSKMYLILIKMSTLWNFITTFGTTRRNTNKSGIGSFICEIAVKISEMWEKIQFFSVKPMSVF